jgi:hypothetical protein
MKDFKKAFKISVPTILILSVAVVLFIAVQDFSRIRNPGVQGIYCINNLRQFDAAKREWALENGKTNGVACTEDDIKPYVKLDAEGNLPKCPQGGIHTIGKVGEPPSCSLGTNVTPAHVIP